MSPLLRSMLAGFVLATTAVAIPAREAGMPSSPSVSDFCPAIGLPLRTDASIKALQLRDHGLLLHYSDNQLWAMGLNRHRRFWPDTGADHSAQHPRPLFAGRAMREAVFGEYGLIAIDDESRLWFQGSREIYRSGFRLLRWFGGKDYERAQHVKEIHTARALFMSRDHRMFVVLKGDSAYSFGDYYDSGMTWYQSPSPVLAIDHDAPPIESAQNRTIYREKRIEIAELIPATTIDWWYKTWLYARDKRGTYYRFDGKNRWKATASEPIVADVVIDGLWRYFRDSEDRLIGTDYGGRHPGWVLLDAPVQRFHWFYRRGLWAYRADGALLFAPWAALEAAMKAQESLPWRLVAQSPASYAVWGETAVWASPDSGRLHCFGGGTESA